MKVLVTGTTGMLGSAVVRDLKRFNLFYDVIESGPSSDRDLTDLDTARDFVNTEKPDVIIHLAAVTSLNECKKNPDKANTLHADLTKVLASSCKRMIYVSTDSVFDGVASTPYGETSDANPVNVYAKSKLIGEAAAINNNKNSVIIRTNIFGCKPGMLADWAIQSYKDNEKIDGYVNVKFNPVYVGDLAIAIRKAIDHDITGVINVAGDTCLSKYHFLKLLYKRFIMDTEMIKPKTYVDHGQELQRPKYTCLQTGLFEKEFDHIFSLDQGLDKLFEEYKGE